MTVKRLNERNVMKKVLCLLVVVFVSGCVSPKCNCKPVWEFCDALLAIDTKLIEIMQRDAKLNRDDLPLLFMHSVFCLCASVHIDWEQLQENIEKAAKDAAEKTDKELGVQ